MTSMQAPTWAPVEQTPVVRTTGTLRFDQPHLCTERSGSFAFLHLRTVCSSPPLHQLLQATDARHQWLGISHCRRSSCPPIQGQSRLRGFDPWTAAPFQLSRLTRRLNPDEWVWEERQSRPHRSRAGIDQAKGNLRSKSRCCYASTQKLPCLIRGSSPNPNLRYIAQPDVSIYLRTL